MEPDTLVPEMGIQLQDYATAVDVVRLDRKEEKAVSINLQMHGSCAGPLPVCVITPGVRQQCTCRHIAVVRIEPETGRQQLLVTRCRTPDQFATRNKVIEKRGCRYCAGIWWLEQARDDQAMHQDPVS